MLNNNVSSWNITNLYVHNMIAVAYLWKELENFFLIVTTLWYGTGTVIITIFYFNLVDQLRIPFHELVDKRSTIFFSVGNYARWEERKIVWIFGTNTRRNILVFSFTTLLRCHIFKSVFHSCITIRIHWYQQQIHMAIVVDWRKR